MRGAGDTVSGAGDTVSGEREKCEGVKRQTVCVCVHESVYVCCDRKALLPYTHICREF